MRRLKKFDILSIMLLILAVVFGGNVAIAGAGTPDPSEASPDTKGLGTEMGGAGASATVANDSVLEAREIDKQMVLLSPYKLPELNVKVLGARQVPVSKYYIEYPISGATPLDFTIDYDVTVSSPYTSATLKPHDGTATGTYQISKDAFRALTETTTFILEGIPGYSKPEEGNTPIEDGDMEAYVKSVDEANYTIVIEPVNGWAYSGGWTNKFPSTIPAGTPIHVMSTACSESQREVAPDNYLPVTKKVYLQKKVSNLVLTDDFLEQIKEIEFGENELSERVEYNHQRKEARTFWLGAEGKRRVKPGKHMAEEDVFYTKGVLRQIQNKYAVDGELEWDDLNRICDIQFGTNSLHDEATVFVGSKFNLKLMRLMQRNQRTDVTLISKFNDELKVGFKSYELNAVGTLNFVHSRTLDDIGYKDCAVVMDDKVLTRYVKYELKKANVDMKKGGGPDGETREAKRKIYTCADGVSLRNSNSILIGPSKRIFNIHTYNDMDTDIVILDSAAIAVGTLGLDPDSTKSTSLFYASGSSEATAAFRACVDAAGNVIDGTRVYLGVDDPYTGRSAGVILVWSTAETSWNLYTGPITYDQNMAA